MQRPHPLLGLLAGAAAGLIATGVLQLARSDRIPAKTPDTGEKPDDLAFYIIGAAVGGVHGLLAEYGAETPAAFDSAYDLATSVLLEPGTPTTPSPLVYGTVLTGVRALLGFADRRKAREA